MMMMMVIDSVFSALTLELLFIDWTIDQSFLGY